jgi:hypothetical protein
MLKDTHAHLVPFSHSPFPVNFSDLVGIPVFYFYLPVYSFWHLDDFSWGATRVIAADDSKKASTVDALDEEQGSCEGDN